ncbi:hypothetical protein ACLB0R_09995 [Sphingomonas sp. GlSt437]|uniref:hypothetical protein n=1 Tax=Sphingomonas sp. GlSt437 TaxID=3389970 RepID=UPI003A877E2A
MNSTTSLAADPAEAQIVTSSDLVRHFGVWQERAARAPVYIMHRGRPRHVLTSVDLMDVLCRPHDSAHQHDRRSTIAALLDITADTLIVVDALGEITGLSLPARVRFGAEARVGAAIDRLLAPGSAAQLHSALLRTRQSGEPTTLSVTTARHPDREFEVEIAPLGGSTLLRVVDLTHEEELVATQGRLQAIERAMKAVATVASATVDVQGNLVDAADALQSLTGLGEPALANASFVSLFDTASRARIAEAMDAVISRRHTQLVSATLLVNRGEALGVTVAMAPLSFGSAINGMTAVIVATPPSA